jgi:colicin import membrane protein
VAIPEKKKPVLAPVEAVESQSAQQNPLEQKTPEKNPGDLIAAQQAEQAARDRAAQDAAIDAMVNEYKAKIVTKVRRNIVKPPNVPDDARAEFRVTLLPGGTVLSAELKRSSGNAAYDNAVERAILKSQPLPLPADVAMFNRFRVLLLVFKPVE